jgi:hypothetical protein
MILISHFRVTTAARFAFLLAGLLRIGALPAHAQDAGTTPGLNPRVSKGNPALRAAGKQSSAPDASPGQTAPPDQAAIERMADSARKVLDRIQNGESDLHQRLTYFEKPDRLDPNSYASKDEVTQWLGILQQLKEQHDRVAQMYSDLGKDLDTALQGTGTNPANTATFRKYIMDGFPWPTIEKKKGLIADYIDEHQKLLLFYQKNWGSWTPRSNPGNPVFNSASAEATYKKLREQILATGDNIEKEYKEMSQ